MTKDDLKNFTNGFLVIIAGFFLCAGVASKTNAQSEFTGYCTLFTAGIITYSAGRILDAIKNINKEDK